MVLATNLTKKIKCCVTDLKQAIAVLRLWQFQERSTSIYIKKNQIKLTKGINKEQENRQWISDNIIFRPSDHFRKRDDF